MSMPWFMVQAAYTPEAWKTQLQNPSDRIAALREMLEPAGVKIHHAWYAFGEYDLILIAEAPGNVEAAAGVLAAAAGGAVKSNKTTPLMTVDEGIEAMRKGGQIAYRAPGQ
jgi:uncharacterized protein with GYD domain